MTSIKKSVYISYSWGAEKKHPLVDGLLATLKEKSIEVKRDSNAINYGDSIKAYMNELAEGRAIILVLSEEYFKSPNCMYELLEIYLNNRNEFRQRIFPVVLQDTPLHSPEDRILYIAYWEKKTKMLDTDLDLVRKKNVPHDLLGKLKDYDDFAKLIGELQSLISDMYCPKEEDLLKTGFAALIERMFSQPAPDGGGGTDKSDREKAAGDQFDSGGGNQQIAKDNATIINNYFSAQKESVPPSGRQRIFYGVPNLPPNHLPRQEYIEEFRAALQKESNVGVEGMGGIGKSVLAAALAHDEAVQTAFPDGIFWLTFGQKVDNDALLTHQNNILKLFGHQERETSLEISRHRLHEVLHGKRCLFIIDDIWDSRHLKCFDLSGTACRFLLTSRKADVLDQFDMERKRVDFLSKTQALAMLAQYAGCVQADLPNEAAEIVKECGFLPLAVAAIGSMVRNKPADRWQLALRKLQEAKLGKIACKFDYQYENLFRALQVSIEALSADYQKYYKTFAVFPEDVDIHESVLELYWEHCGFRDEYPKDVIDALVDASLLTRVNDNILRLHDLLRDYLISQTEDIAALHKQLLDAYKAEYPGGWHTIPVDNPFYFHNYWHIHAETVNDEALSFEIAEDLIFHQPNINYNAFKNSLKFINQQLIDIAPLLLREKRDIFVLRDCLHSLGSAGKQEAHCLLKERLSPYVEYACLEFLGEEGRQYAKLLIKESDNWLVLHSCLKLLKEDAKEDARRILTENKYPELTVHCLSILGDKAKEDVKQLLRSTEDEYKLIHLFFLVGNDDIKEAKEVAQRLLETTKEEFIKTMCQYHLNMWGYEENP